VTAIHKNAFAHCVSLTDVTIPAGVTVIGDNAFYNCGKLHDVTIPRVCSSIGEGAFCQCSTFTTVNIPRSVTSVGHYAFHRCKKVSSLSLSSAMTSIGDYAFDGLDISTLSVPDTVTSLGQYAFAYNSKLHTVELSKNLGSIPNGLFSECVKLSKITIPDGVKSFGHYAFNNCSSLSSINVPEGVTWFGDYSFNQCVSLTSIYIPEYVTSIGHYAFCNCSKIPDVYIPDRVGAIGDYAFAYCNNLVNVIIPDSSQDYLYSYAFAYCTGIKTVFYQGARAVDNNILTGCDNIINVCVPPEYPADSKTFGGKATTNYNDICLAYRSLFNKCYKGDYVKGDLLCEHRRSAIEWEQKTTGCVVYKCYNNSGFMEFDVCKSDTVELVCLKDKCIINNTGGKEWSVVIDFQDAVDASQMNSSQIRKILAEYLKISDEGVSIGWETDDNGYIIRVIIYVDDEKTAKMVKSTLDELQNGCDEKNYGILCQKKTVSEPIRVDVSGSSDSYIRKRNLIIIFSCVGFVAVASIIAVIIVVAVRRRNKSARISERYNSTEEFSTSASTDDARMISMDVL